MTSATEAAEAMAQAEKRAKRRLLHIFMIGWSVLLAAVLIYGLVQARRQLAPQVTVGNLEDFPPGSVTAFALNTSFEDPDSAEGSVVSPVPVYVVHDPEIGFMALYNRDPHMGCQLEWVAANEWFEDPCHGSRYNLRGEWISGPAGRGLDRFQVRVSGRGRVVVDTHLFQIGSARQ